MKKIFLIIVITFVPTKIILSQEIINKGKLSGYMFGDYFYNLSRDTLILSLPDVANGGKKDFNGFQFRRIYFTYDYNISESFATRFRLEADGESNTSNGKISVFVKDAYINWKNFFKGSDLIFGIQPTPAFEISESIWGNRFLEKTIMDLRGIVSSRDFALTLKGKIDSKGILKYWLMIGNGNGNKPETDKYKRFYAHIQYSPIKQFTATIYADLKSRPKINHPKSFTNPQETVVNNDLTYALFFGFKEKDAYSFGFEGFLNTRQNGMFNNGSLKNKTGLGLTVFATYNFSKKIDGIVRFDYYDPNTDKGVNADSRKWLLLSLNYKPNDKVIISPNIIVETYESLRGEKGITPSITPRITILYIFL